MPSIETSGLTKHYGDDVVAVDSLDLTVRSGEVFGFLGPNGAGKSTTIDLLLGFTTPSAGEGTVLGTNLSADPTSLRRNVGVLPDGYSVYPELTGREHLESMLRLKSGRDDPDRIFDVVGLSQVDRDRPTGEYSKGMRQRLALGMALICRPELLILDEPTSGLDPDGISMVRDIVQQQAEQGTTVFFSSHHLTQVEAVCDRVGIMNQGQLVAVDDVEVLQEKAPAETRLLITLSEEPRSDTLKQVSEQPGVSVLSTNSEKVAVGCQEPAAKARAITTLQTASSVEDFEVEATSLEHVFEAFTGSDFIGDNGNGATAQATEVATE